MIDKLEYKRSCTEMLEILKYIKKDDYEKIPSNMVKVLEKNKDKEYFFEFDVSKTLDEQNVLKSTRYFIAIFFERYWANPKQKEKINEYEKLYNEQINEKYKEDMFKRRNKKNEINENKQRAIYKPNILMLIINKIKSIWKKY